MADYGIGAFWGYREIFVAPLRPPMLRLGGAVNPPKLESPIRQRVGIPGYDYRAYHGNPTAVYPESWTQLPWSCRMASWMLDGGPIEVQFSYDGNIVQDTRVFRHSIMTLDSFRAFRVRLLVPGHLSAYRVEVII